jgi:septum formation protein
VGIQPDAILSPNVDETPLRGELPRDYALRIAQAKAQAVDVEGIVLAADTTVACGRRILGQAQCPEEAQRFLLLLSGRRHHVYTAVAVRDATGHLRTRLSTSIVTFQRLTPEDVTAYLALEEWRGKAGGYAIQGHAAQFVRALQGSYSGVVGLPLFETCALLKATGWH